MHLVDHQDDVAELFHLVDQAFHAALKLPAELRTRDERGQIEQVDLLVPHLERHLALVDAHRQPFGHGGLAHAGLADQTGVVLLAAVEDLDDAVGFAVAADDMVDAALGGFARQVFTVVVQVLALFILARGRLRARRQALGRSGRTASRSGLIGPRGRPR